MPEQSYSIGPESLPKTVLHLPASFVLTCVLPLIIKHAQAAILAPPLSSASISASVHRVRWNLFGNSFRSQNSPFAGSNDPSSLAECPPMAPYGLAVCAASDPLGAPCLGDDDDCEDDCGCCPPSGPYCVALSRYEAKDSGSLWVGDAGWACGEWSTSGGGG